MILYGIVACDCVHYLGHFVWIIIITMQTRQKAWNTYIKMYLGVSKCVFGVLIHWGLVTHIYIYASLNWVIIGLCNGLSPIRHQTITGIDGYPATPLHCPRDRSLPVAGCYFSGSPCAALVSRLQSTSPTNVLGFRLGNREQWSPTGHVFPSDL